MMYDKETYHYIFLHFPIALFSVGYLFNVFAFFLKDELLDKFGFWNLGLGIISGIISIITGFITDNVIVGHMTDPFPIWYTHGSHMIIAIIIFYLFFILKFYWGSLIKDKYLLFLHTLLLLFFIHGTHIGAKLADRI